MDGKFSAPRFGAGAILEIISLLSLLVGFIFYFLTFDALGYGQDHFVIASTAIAIWILLALLVTDFFDAKRPIVLGAAGIVYCFLLLFCFARIISPCISPIGVLYTVNMGDKEAYAIGVPRCFVSIGAYLFSAITFVVANFFSPFFHKEAKQ